MGEKMAAPCKRRRIRISHILILLLIIAIGAFIFYRINLKHKLNARIESLRSAGYPVTIQELDKWYSIPDNSENSADVILESSDYYLQDQNDLEILPIIGSPEIKSRKEPLPEVMMKDILKYLTKNQKCLELLHTTKQFKYGRFPIDLTSGYETLLPHLSCINSSAKLLQLEAVYQSECNEPELAIESIESLFGLYRSLTMEPSFTSQFSRSSIRNRVYQAIERMMNRMNFQEKELLQLQELIKKNIDFSGMARGIAGDTCSTLDMMRNITIIDGKSLGIDLPPVPVLEACKALGLVDREIVMYLDLQQEYQKVFELPVKERFKALQFEEAKHREVLKKCFLLRSLMPELSQIIKMDLRNIVNNQIVLTALAVQRYRLKTKNLPESLSELVPDYLESIPEDLFDGQELRYKKFDTGFVIYSIGDDLIDDGGKEKPKNSGQKHGTTWDITFIIEK